MRVPTAIVATIISCVSLISEQRSGQPPAQAPVQSPIVEVAGFGPKGDLALVRPMVESEASVASRARATQVSPSSVRPKAYGVEVYVVFQDAEMGAAFLRRIKAYHLRAFNNDRIITDETYWYCNGFQAADILRITEKSWSRYYDSPEADVAVLDALSESVQRGIGHADAVEAVASLRPTLLKNGGEQQRGFEREVTWFAGRQEIDGVPIELMRSKLVGNRVSIQFAR